MRYRLIATTALVAGLLAATPAMAANLKIGLSAEPSALDPHYHNLIPNNSMSAHIFDALMLKDDKQRLSPGLAVSWKTLNDTTWEFKLRKGVKFHDGSPFTAKDVVFSLCRVPNVPNSPSAFTIYTKSIESVETPDDYTVLLKTKTPYPLMPGDISGIGILPAKSGKFSGPIVFKKAGCEGITAYPSTEDINAGKVPGTGPFVFKEFVKGDRIVLTKNPSYWGRKVLWDTVTFKPIPSDGPRVAALLAGDVDFIENPPSQDLAKLRKDKNLHVVDGLSNRVIYVALDSFREPLPGVSGTGDKNPLKDARVRKALSLAIDRKAIQSRIMVSQSEPAGQIISPGMYGYNPKLKPDLYDAKEAKKLLAEAGYPKGFTITLGTPNDRYMNDEKVAQAIAQYWTRIGVKTNVDASTKSVFFSRRNKYDFPAYLAGWGSSTGEASSPLKSLVACRNPEIGFGSTNRSRYCNPKMDDVLKQALSTIDDAKREALLQEALAMVAADTGIVPIHFEKTPWAMKKNLTYVPRMDQWTFAMDVKPAK